MGNIDKPVMVFNRSIEEINREREAHKRSQKIQDLKEGLAEIKFFFHALQYLLKNGY